MADLSPNIVIITVSVIMVGFYYFFYFYFLYYGGILNVSMSVQFKTGGGALAFPSPPRGLSGL